MKQLIDNNENQNPEYQLSIQNFNLSPEHTESILEIGRRERETEKRNLKLFIDDINRITNWIIENTWNLMNVKYCNLHGIFSNIICENFGLIHIKNDNYKNDIQTIILLRSTELYFNKNNDLLYNPLLLTTSVKDSNNLHHYSSFMIKESSTSEIIQFKINNNDNTNDNDNLIKNDKNISSFEKINLYSYNLENYKSSYAFSGTSTHNFIEPSKYRYKQHETITFYQMFVEQILCEVNLNNFPNFPVLKKKIFFLVFKCDILNLRKWFNQKFDEMKNFKQDQVKQIIEKNQRLRYIQSELNILAKLLGDEEKEFEEILDPDFYSDEEPINIIKV